MNYNKIIQLIAFLIFPLVVFSQELPEGGEELISKEQARQFRNKQKIESIFFDANKAKITDNPEEAARLFKEVTELDPSHDASWYELGLLHYKKRDVANAIKFISKAYQLKPDNMWYGTTLASLYSQNSQFNEALKIYEALHKRKMNDRSISMELANLYLKTDKPTEALKIYDEIQSIEGVNEEISLRKHHIYLSQGKKKKAIEELEKLASHNEYDTRIQSLLAEYYMSNGFQDEALKTYEKILAIDPENPYINISLADFYRKQGDMKKSIQVLKRGFSNQYLDAPTKMQILSTYYSQVGNYPGIEEDIIDLSTILVDQHPFDPQVLAFRAQMLAIKEQYPEALVLFKKVSDLDPGKYEVWENILRLTAALNEYDSLVIYSKKAVDLFPVQPMPYYFLAASHFMLENFDESLKAINSGIKLIFNNSQLMSEFYSLKGDTYYKAKKNEDAYSAYETSLKYNPDNPSVLNNYAYYLSLENKDLNKAEQMAVKANRLSPDNATFLDTYAWVLYKKGNYQEAKVQMEKVLNLEPDSSGVVLEHYGDILFKLNNHSEAIKWWEKANAKGGGSDNLQMKIKDKKLYE